MTGTASLPRLKATPATPFHTGCGFYRLFWVFTIGSVTGTAVETVFVYLLRGVYECRASLLYGPFNVVYGIGAIGLFLGCYHLGGKGRGAVFLYGAVMGTAVEYLCSFLQESIWGTVSWEYSDLPLNINGRVCLLFSFFWGLLALAWFLWAQPALDKTLSRLPLSTGKLLTWLLFAFLVADCLLSLLAVTRWLHRLGGLAPTGTLAMWLDTFYPDSIMQATYGEMLFV